MSFLRKIILFSFLILSILGNFGVVQSAFNEKINYQGKLTDTNNMSVADGAYDVVFKLYTVAGGGAAIWTESWTNAALWTEASMTFTNDGCAAGIDKVAYTTATNESSLAAGQQFWNTTKKESAIIQSVDTGNNWVCVYDTPSAWATTDGATNRIYIKNGLFSVMLGEVASLSSIDFNQTLYLGVTVGADSEMMPRKVIGAVPAAFEAKQLEGATWASPGAIGSGTPNTGVFTGLTSSGNSNLASTAGSTFAFGNSTGTATLQSGGISSWINTSGDLSISTATSGTFGLTSAGALNLSAGSASTWTLPNVANALNFDSDTLTIDALNNRVGIGDITPASMFTVGNGDLFQVNSSGQIAAIAGYTQGSGNFAISGTGTFGTGTGAISFNGDITIAANKSLTITAGTGALSIAGYSGTGNALSVTSSSTTASNKALNISQTGATTGTDYGLYSANTGAGTTNVGGYFSASGATNNYGLIVENGNVGIGTTDLSDSKVKILAGDSGNLTLTLQENSATNNTRFDLRRSRGSSSSQTIVASGDYLGAMRFSGYDGASYIVGATIRGEVDGTPGTNDMPGRLTFLTTADGESAATERMRIDSSGNVGIGTIDPTGNFTVAQGTSGVGTVSNLAGGTTVTGVNTQFLNTFRIGDTITINGETVAISAIASDTSMTTAAITNANSGVAYTLVGGTRMVVQGNGNVGIGTASPGEPLFIQRDQNSGTYLTVRNATSGTSAYETFRLTEDNISKSLDVFHLNTSFTTNGILTANTSYIDSVDSGGLVLSARDAAGVIKFATGGLATSNERVRIDSSGNVGIGATNPGAKLEIEGAAAAGGTSFVLVHDTTSGGGTPLLQFSSNSENGYIFSGQGLTDVRQDMFGVQSDHAAGLFLGTNSASGIIKFTTGSLSERMRISSSGNIGINTTGPDRRLDILEAANPQLRLTQTDGTTYADMQVDSNGDLIMNVDGVSNQLVLDNGGYVGFGTNTPLSKVDVAGTIRATGYTDPTGGRGLELYTWLNQEDEPSIVLSFDRTAGTFEPLRIYGSYIGLLVGNVGAGTTTPESKLQVTGGGLCVGSDANCNTDNNTEGVVYSSSTAMTAYDVAENYPTKDATLVPAEVVTLDNSQEGPFVKRGNAGETLVGVVSTAPAVLMGGFNGQEYKEEKQVAVALSGRVPVKVSLENGPIEAGDYLTSSSVAGAATKAIKAGRVVGVALESYDSQEAGSIMVFVNPHWYGGEIAENGTLTDPSGESIIVALSQSQSFKDLVASTVIESLATLSGTVSAAGEWTFEKLTAKQICVEDVCVNRDQLQELLNNNAVPAPESAVESTPTPTPTPEPTVEIMPVSEPVIEPVPPIAEPTPTPELAAESAITGY